jgi:hypothetical protein
LAVIGSNQFKPGVGAVLAALALSSAALLGGCSSRDTETSEKAAAATAAATRAEQAALRAESAAAKAEKASQPQVVEGDPNADDDAQDQAIAAENEPPSNEPNKG